MGTYCNGQSEHYSVTLPAAEKNKDMKCVYSGFIWELTDVESRSFTPIEQRAFEWPENNVGHSQFILRPRYKGDYLLFVYSVSKKERKSAFEKWR